MIRGVVVKRALILIALGAVLAAPFALRPAREVGGEGADTVVIITPHNEAIRHEFSRGFAAWYRARTGRAVQIDWRVVGGTSDIARYLESTYLGAFRAERERHGLSWTPAVQGWFQSAQLPADAPPEVRAARKAFLASNVSCGIDVFFGGDAYQFGKEAAAGRLVDSGVRQKHPDWFTDQVMPASHGGEPFRDPGGRWFGVVLSSYGIIFNRDRWRGLGLTRDPARWSDLADARLAGEVGLADPTKSGSVCEAFESMLQQRMQRRLAHLQAARPEAGLAEETQALREGWVEGMRLIQALGANARYFTDNAQKPPIDVAAGDCVAGLCIDFYGRQQQESVRRRGHPARTGFAMVAGGSGASSDPIGLLRGAPHPEVAARFIEYTLSMDGQKLWALQTGVPGGPERFALRRMPIRRDFYRLAALRPVRSDPDDDPYDASANFVYHPEWTGRWFRDIGFVTRVMCQDTHLELVAAMRAIRAAPEPARSRALAVLQDVRRVDYEQTRGEIHRRLNATDRVEEVRLATELGAWFRSNYRRAAAIARGEAAGP